MPRLLTLLSPVLALLSLAHATNDVQPCDPSPIFDPNHDRLGAVASESAVCSKVGIDLLKSGGNAADALVGTMFCVGVIGMYHSGIGGGGFMLVRAANGSYEFIDFRCVDSVCPALQPDDDGTRS